MTGQPLLWVFLVTFAVFSVAFALAVLSDVLVYRDLQRRLMREREKRTSPHEE